MYTEFYGLRAEPFLLTPDHRFYFDSTVHSQAMAHLIYGVNRGEGFIVVTGDIGAGKTTLVKRLCASIDAEKISAAHVVTTLVSGSDLLRMVMASFGLTDIPTDKGSMLLRLQRFFETAHRDGKRALLIVDEAQNLNVSALEELRMLSNFQVNNTAPFQAFLVGQPQFRDVLANPALEQLRQRIITSYHLGPMNCEEVGEYLPHRLKRVGWTNDPEFLPDAVDAIYRHTDGIPRRINTLCSRVLLLGFLDNLHSFGSEEVDRVAQDMVAEHAAPEPASVPVHNGNGAYNGTGHNGNGAYNGNGGNRANGVATAHGDAHDSGPRNPGDLGDRVRLLEERLNRQDENINRAAAAFRDFLRFALTDRDGRSE